jgi:hypothetical protein
MRTACRLIGGAKAESLPAPPQQEDDMRFGPSIAGSLPGRAGR